MKRVLVAGAFGWLAGCGSIPTTTPVGAFAFPDGVDLHNPVLVLTATNTFAFVGEIGEDWANHGTVTRRNNYTLLLRYNETECCQYEGVEEEPLVILETRSDAIRVRYRDGEHWLEKISR